MAPQSAARALKKPLRLDDEVRFLRSWIEKPLHMGAVMPSGKVLARTVARYVDIHSSAPVIELGPGTGAITDALLARGVLEKRLVLVEFDPGFCALLRNAEKRLRSWHIGWTGSPVSPASASSCSVRSSAVCSPFRVAGQLQGS